MAAVDVVGVGPGLDVREVGCGDGLCGSGGVVVGCGSLVGRVGNGEVGRLGDGCVVVVDGG